MGHLCRFCHCTCHGWIVYVSDERCRPRRTFRDIEIQSGYDVNRSHLGFVLRNIISGGWCRGVLLFGFVASWLFGREYADGTAKDQLALPVSRTQILNAKYIYYVLW